MSENFAQESNSPVTSEGNLSWTDRIKQMYSKTAELFKNYSEQLNIAGGAARILGGGAMMVAGAAHPGLIDSSTVNHAYLFSGCALAMAGTLNVNKTVETRLIEDGRMDPEDSWHHQHLAGEYDSPRKGNRLRNTD